MQRLGLRGRLEDELGLRHADLPIHAVDLPGSRRRRLARTGLGRKVPLRRRLPARGGVAARQLLRRRQGSLESFDGPLVLDEDLHHLRLRPGLLEERLYERAEQLVGPGRGGGRCGICPRRLSLRRYNLGC